MKVALFGEKLITRESICGQFPPSGLAWGGIWDRFLRKMLVGRKQVGSKNNQNRRFCSLVARHRLIFGGNSSHHLQESFACCKPLRDRRNSKTKSNIIDNKQQQTAKHICSVFFYKSVLPSTHFKCRYELQVMPQATCPLPLAFPPACPPSS